MSQVIKSKDEHSHFLCHSMKFQNKTLHVFSSLEKKQTNNHIENLSNEIFYEIFDYLDGCDIYHAFSNLNIRFQDLLTHSTFYLKIQFLSKSQSNLTMKDRYKRYIFPNKHRIISLFFSDQLYYKQFIRLSPINSTFNYLKSIVIKNISTVQFVVLLFYLKSLSHLSSLQVSFDNCNDEIGDIYKLIFQLPFLKYLKVEGDCFEVEDLNLPMATNEQHTLIESFIILHYLTIDQFSYLVSYTPRLIHLYCFSIVGVEYMNSMEIFTNMINLVQLNLSIHDLPFDLGQIFLSKLPSQLKILNVKISDENKNYLNACQWEELIRKKFPILERFTLCYEENLDEDFQITRHHRTIVDYLSSFWLKKQWIFKIILDDNKISYCVYPYKIKPYDFQEHESFNRNSSLDYSYPGATMIINMINSNKTQVYIHQLKFLFEMINITRLEITFCLNSIQTSIKILKSLRNLITIRITFSTHPNKFITIEKDMKQFQKYLKKSKITNVTITDIKDSDYVNFIIDLFPRMKSLAIQTVSNNDLVLVTEWILRKIQMNQMVHPMRICLMVKEGTNDRIQKLYEMINSKKLLKNYTIYRQLDQFYIKWN